MALHIICGRAGSGKSTLCINKIAEHLTQSDSPVYLIVPEQYTLQAEERLLAHPDCKGLLGNEVVSFKRMAFRVLSRSGGLAHPKLNPSGRIMLLNYVVIKTVDSLTYFKSLKEKPGELNRLLGLIDEFGRYEISPDMLKSASDSARDKNLKSKLGDLSLIYGTYRELLLKDNIDEQDVYSAFLEKLRDHKPFAGSVVWLDSFAGFTSYEFDIVKELINQCEDIYITLCKDENQSFIFERVERTYNALINIVKEIKAEIKVEYLKTGHRFLNNPYIAHLEKYFGEYPAKKMSGCPRDLRILECSNIYTEVESSAREIVRLLREKKYRYGDIAVTARNIETYENIIKVIYPKYNIPYFIDTKKDIEDHPLIRFIINLLDIVGGNWEYSFIFDFLKTGLYTEDRESVDYLENYVIEKGIRGKKEWSSPVPDHEGAESIREKLYKDISEFEEKFRECRNISNCCKTICSFFNDLNIQETMQQKADSFREKQMAILADEYARIWNITMDVIEQVYIFLGNTKCEGSLKGKAKQLKDILKSGFSEYKIGFIPYTKDSVQVGVADRTRRHDIKAVILLGANEGVFPKTFQDNGFLSDNDREFLQKEGISLAEDNRTKSNMEYYLIYTVIASMSEYLQVSYPLEGAGGDPLRPSVIIRRVMNLFPDLKVEKDYTMDLMGKLTLPSPFLTENAGALRKENSQVASGIKKWYRSSEEYMDLFNRYMSCKTEFDYEISLPRDVMNELFDKNLYMSASRIEKYNSCPYSYYLTYGIKAAPRKENKFEKTDVGTLMHTLMDKASKSIEGTLDSIEDCDKLMDSVFDKALEEIGIRAFTETERSKYITHRLLRYAKEAFKVANKQIMAGYFVPGGYEVKFGAGGELPPVTVDTGDGKFVYITGRIDRYDTYETDDAIYFRVVDYKSSEQRIKTGDLINGQKIQLIAYIDALQNGLQKEKGKTVIPVAALYYTLKPDVESIGKHPEKDESIKKKYQMNGFVLSDPKVLEFMVGKAETDVDVIGVRKTKDDNLSLTAKSGIVPPGGFEKLRKQLHKTVKEAYSGMSRGCINVSPVDNYDFKTCDFCDFGTICGIDTSKPDNFKRFPKIDEDTAYEIMGSDD